MKKELIHFIRWEKVQEKDVESVLAELPEWGVENIVAHPKWFRSDGESYVRKIQNLLEKYHLRSTACHALWGTGNDCINPDPVIQNDMIRRQSIFLRELRMLKVTTFTIHLGYRKDMSLEENFSLLEKSVDSRLRRNWHHTRIGKQRGTAACNSTDGGNGSKISSPESGNLF